MKIAFLTPSASRKSGGIFEIERRLGQTLAGMPDTAVSVHALEDEFSRQDLPLWQPLRPQTFAVKGPRALGYSHGLMAAFLAEEADVAHLHCLWMHTSAVVARWGKLKRRPYVVTPNGMLEPWALRNSAWKKKLAGWLYENTMLRQAACLQANTVKEAEDFRAFDLKNPIAIIPNGIDLPEITGLAGSPDLPVWSNCLGPERKVLLFLSRIHPKKGLVNLLKAWAQLPPATPSGPAWTLAIAGWDQGGHEAELKQLATDLRLAWTDLREPQTGGGPWSVVFLGPQFNAAKSACYRHCHGFVLPSFSEGLPMAVLEAWAHGRPVLMTPECNLPEGFATGAAIQIGSGVPEILHGLTTLVRAGEDDLAAIGACGRELVATRFTWPKVAGDMRLVYDWLLHGGAAPACIV